jgi:hypothetical protein
MTINHRKRKMKKRIRYKDRNKDNPQNTLSGSGTDQIPPMRIFVTKIATNVCEQKGDCGLCDKGARYGVSLPFVLHLEDKSILTVCARCAKAEAARRHLPLPPTNLELERLESAKDRRIIYMGLFG